ncbi:MAG TPA: GAF domain-containing SpoIIE family protein phosphatase [Ktedonobacteraceae bacterium]|nr:GAF domain-containing SpoIIE family protein phosphatase [Ktedonobacteraceae bacterium]
MPVYQVSSRSVPEVPPPVKKPRRLPPQWSIAIHFIIAVGGAGGIFALLTIFKGPTDTIFLLLPVLVYLAAMQFQSYNPNIPAFFFTVFFRRTPAYLLFTVCFAFVYYGAITGIELFIHQATVSHIILITTALTWTIMLDPVRVFVQRRIERRFNPLDREVVKEIEAFTETLREEIDLDQLRERFLTVIQHALQPYFVSLWVQAFNNHRKQAGSTEVIVVADDDPLLAYLLKHPGVLEIDRLRMDSPAIQGLKLHAAELLVPLTSQGELIGLVVLGSHLKGEVYTNEELKILVTLAPQVAPSLRVAQLVQEQQAQVLERERIEQELRTAQAIQHAFLPKEVPVFPGWQLVTYYRPAREVGGDFYDFLPLKGGRWGLIIGDVTGKGVPAALVMATVHTMLRSTAQGSLSPSEVLARVNDLLVPDIPQGMFVTCFFALLDPASGRLYYSNAGHEPPYRQQDRNVTELWATGMPLGMLPGSRYEEHEATITPGESLIFYSDGLVEAHSPAKEMFGFPRMQKVLEERCEDVSLIETLLAELHSFTGEGWEQEDDVTLVSLQRTP